MTSSSLIDQVLLTTTPLLTSTEVGDVNVGMSIFNNFTIKSAVHVQQTIAILLPVMPHIWLCTCRVMYTHLRQSHVLLAKQVKIWNTISY